MKNYQHSYSTYEMSHFRQPNWKNYLIIILACIVIADKAYDYLSEYANYATEGQAMDAGKIYLLDEAASAGTDTAAFKTEIIRIADTLNIPESWLMAIIHLESRFYPSQKNKKGSGATGLIQFMPRTAAAYGTTCEELAEMDATEQLYYVQSYLENEVATHGGFFSLTDLYLSVLYPNGRTHLKTGNYKYIIFPRKSLAYQQNSGLDYDRNGDVTIMDISKYLHHQYTPIYE